MFCNRCGAENADGAKFCRQCGNLLNGGETKEKKNNKVIYIVIGAIVIIIAIVLAVVLGMRGKKAKEYETCLASAEKYIEELNYEQAKDYYLQAIRVAPRELEPYVRLAGMYVDLEEIEKAEEILAMAEENNADGSAAVKLELEAIIIDINEIKNKNNNLVDVSKFFNTLDNLEMLIEELEMETCERWQFSDSESYEKEGFYVEYLKEENVFSMKNESSLNVNVYGIQIGDDFEIADVKLKAESWIRFGTTSQYVLLKEDETYMIQLDINSDMKVKNWYLNNWPEGEDISLFIEELRGNNNSESNPLLKPWESELEQTEQESEELEELLNNAMSQYDLNQYSYQLYKLWDDEINRLWQHLKDNLDEDEMEALTEVQREWIKEKEAAIENAGKEWEGGSGQPMAENTAGWTMTEERVYELIEYLR